MLRSRLNDDFQLEIDPIGRRPIVVDWLVLFVAAPARLRARHVGVAEGRFIAPTTTIIIFTAIVELLTGRAVKGLWALTQVIVADIVGLILRPVGHGAETERGKWFGEPGDALDHIAIGVTAFAWKAPRNTQDNLAIHVIGPCLISSEDRTRTD